MTLIDYTRFDIRRLAELLERSKRTEDDFQALLDARLRNHRERPSANGISSPDPVAKRLAFLAGKARSQRRALERELATRPGRSTANAAAAKPLRAMAAATFQTMH